MITPQSVLRFHDPEKKNLAAENMPRMHSQGFARMEPRAKERAGSGPLFH
jgi:hypothetical protein